MKKRVVLLNIISSIAIIFLLWFLISFIDVIAHNNIANPTYLSWNLFQIFFPLQ